MQFRPLTVLIFLSFMTFESFGYEYEKKIINSNVVHIVKLDSHEYEARLIKANNGQIGRETVSSMAKKSDATLAINGGFFEIGGAKDGKPSGSLIIENKVYNLKKSAQPLIIINNGQISIKHSNAESILRINVSILSGIPLLLSSGKIPKELVRKKTAFYSKPHARTALGIDSKSKIIIVLAEHHYSKDLTKITLEELQNILSKDDVKYAKKFAKHRISELTLKELKQIVKDEFTSKNGVKGLTILELANFMKELGCHDAINLDGGGSSTLWIDGKVVNNTIGDQDEASGDIKERPVSDAIIFRKRF